MDFKTLLEQISAAYNKFNTKQKIIIAVTIFIIIGLLVFLILYKNSGSKEAENYAVLFDKLDPKDAAIVIQQLETDKVPYKVVNEDTIKVPKEFVYKERISLASKGIPKNSKVGFELFDKQEFGATEFEQRIKYLRALEGELARTIESLEPIENAVVHIALPKESVFTEKSVPPTASVSLTIKPYTKLSPKQIMGIKNLVAAAVPKLTPENVKLIDQNGDPLGGEDMLKSELIASQIKYKKEFERAYEKKIVNLLAPVVGGEDKVVAKVTIDFDFSQEDEVSEYYDPDVVPRSEQTTEEEREGFSKKEVGGVPGAISNIGPVQGIESNKPTSKYKKSVTTTNYEVSKKILNKKGAFARIKRITAAVVVDGKYRFKKDKEGKETSEIEYVPLSKQEIANITDIVKKSIGYDPKRGDEVTVSNFEFSKGGLRPKAPVTKTLVEKTASFVQPLMPFIKFAIAIVLLFLFYKRVIVPFSQKMLEETKEEEERLEKLAIEEEKEAAEDTLEQYKNMKKKIEEELGLGEQFDEEELKYEVLLEKMKQIASENPEEVANILQTLVKSVNEFEPKK
ncbi:MAG: flagellar basal body M-ring protein FliF [Epsilonproteobacteria bacterium]|nr:flagellar basal body M-ring protein FliF [Campylobacterota bacterium]